MIKRSTQRWQVGEIVNVGFMRLCVVARVATPGNGLPDQYALESLSGRRAYRFIPHNGLTRCDSITEAMTPA